MNLDDEFEKARRFVYHRIDAHVAAIKAQMKHGTENRRSAAMYLRWMTAKDERSRL